ncbi:MAG: hypothetical protein QM581_06110 [Pseudomonas sp.]
MKALYVAPLLAALLTACSATPKTFEIDNPTGAAVTLRIDGTEHRVPAGGSVALELDTGAHTLHSEALGDINFLVSSRDRGGLINPTRSAYVIASSTSPSHEPVVSRFDDTQPGATLDGTLYAGPYRVSNEPIIARSWRAGVHDAPPGGRVAADEALADAKIFAARDFVDYYHEVVEGPGTFAYVIDPAMPSPTYLTALQDAGLPSLSPLFGQHAGELRSIYTAYLGSFEPALSNRDAGTRLVYVQPGTSRHAVQRP